LYADKATMFASGGSVGFGLIAAILEWRREEMHNRRNAGHL
jgi:hypothetical protein